MSNFIGVPNTDDSEYDDMNSDNPYDIEYGCPECMSANSSVMDVGIEKDTGFEFVTVGCNQCGYVWTEST